jgi:hypothetical protein
MTPFGTDFIIYRHELAYLRGNSLAGYRIRKENKMWLRLRRYLTLWSVLLASGLAAAVATPTYA